MTFIRPEWPAPSSVQSLITTRRGGVSHKPFDDFNTALHVGDDEAAVLENRRRLQQFIGCEHIQWLNQVHGTEVLSIDVASATALEADGLVTRVPGLVCVVQTADCLPLLLCNKAGTQVAAVHAGWRGLAAGIISKACQRFDQSSEILAYFGPALSVKHFEVGEDVYQAFVGWSKHRGITQRDLQEQFTTLDSPTGQPQKYKTNLYGLARLELNKSGVQHIYGGNDCSFEQRDSFFSYRRDGRTGRMASLIWLQPE